MLGTNKTKAYTETADNTNEHVLDAYRIPHPGRAILNKFRCFTVCLAVAASCLESAYAANTGQDPTKPVTRFDIRVENDELPYDNTNNNNDATTIILRADAPIPLGPKAKNGTLAIRTDIPFMSTRTNVPGDSGTFGFGSVYFQALHIVPKRWGNLPKASAWAWGYAAQAATATDGRQNVTDIYLFGSKWNIGLNSKAPGTHFSTAVLKYYDGEEEPGFDAINELHVQPIINFHTPVGIDYITLWGNFDWVFNFEDGPLTGKQSGDYFIPYDITIGKMLSDNTVTVSGSFAGKLISSDSFIQFDERFMLRLGFFFK